jgi:dihydroorotase
MSEPFDFVLHGGTTVSHRGIEPADVGVHKGRIAEIGSIDPGNSGTEIDATGLYILPGVIDTQVHFREPGMEQKENLESGTRAAVMGGITGVFEMPNTNPLTDSPAALADKVVRMNGRAWCDYAFYLGATAENADKLGEWENLPGCCGIKIFMGSSTGDLLVADDETLHKVLSSGRRRIAVHCEDEDRLQERKGLAKVVSDHPVWRDVETALKATKRIVHIARDTGRRVHVLHVTTTEEMEFLGHHRKIASVEVTPQHLTLAAPECYDEMGSRAQMNPPIRGPEHRKALWAGLNAGIVDVIGSDHAPHTLEEKSATYPATPSGMPGVQTLLPIMLDHVAAGRMGLLQLHDLVCAGPARLFNIAGKGRLAVGYDADFSVVDLGRKVMIDDSQMASKAGWTPFAGRTLTGAPVMTIIRGEVVMREGELLARPKGRAIRFW